ncbi:MAG TPA: hypothetical protein VGL15_10790 [Vicinamibacteria bacterium]|jgi:hypothetical protein
MQVERSGDTVRVVLTSSELRLLRRALERASFIDTPVSEQADIAAFCARALEALPLPPK